MARKSKKNDEKKFDNAKSIGIAQNINNLISDLYRKTYYTNTDAKDALENIKMNSDKAIDKLINKSIDINGANMSKLYSRLEVKKKLEDKKTRDAFETMFEDEHNMDGLLSTYINNKYLKELDSEIDVICKYMPQLEDVLTIKRDNILSSDTLSSDFINAKSITTIGNQNQFKLNIDTIKSTYKLVELFEKAYMNISKYGEEFIYVVPYNKAIAKEYDKKNSLNISEMTLEPDADIINESTEEMVSFKVKFDKSTAVESLIKESLYLHEKGSSIIDSDKLDIDSFSSSNDGIIDNKEDKTKIDITGCIVKRVPRENIIPLYIDNICIGYYYVESEQDNLFDAIQRQSNPLAGIKRNGGLMNQQNQKDIKKSLLKNLSKKLSEQIDKKFINANQDLSKEIYMILKHSNFKKESQIRISFIPPNEMFHLYFDKDEKTNRGQSDLLKSLIPAKLYSALYISSSIGILTRSQDKRAYFVKQAVDKNISKNLINTINQIKKANFGMREVENLNNILGITGRYNDYVIPTSNGGERPIEFEIVSGQDIDTNDDFMEKLELMATKPLGVPYELIDSMHQVDYASRLKTSNIRFAKHVSTRQSRLQVMFGQVLTAIYNYQFNDNELITIVLPPPSHLNIQNINELWDTTEDLVSKMVEMELTDKDREDANIEYIFKKNLIRYYLSTYIDWNHLDTIKRNSKLESKLLQDNEDEGY